MSRPDLGAAADDAVAAFTRRPVGAFVDPCLALQVRIVRLSFVSDHGLLTDYDLPYTNLDRWLPGGTRYKVKAPSEWAEDHSFPISQTKNTRLSVIPEFEISTPQAAAVQAEVQARAITELLGIGPRPEWAFDGTTTFQGRTSARTSLTANAPLADLVTQHFRSLFWDVTIRGCTYHAGSTSLHHVYATYGTPVPGGAPQKTPYGADPPVDEEGITEHRMRAAVVLAERQIQRLSATERNDPHTIVQALMALVRAYTLRRDPAVPIEFDHPRYYPDLRKNEDGTPWPRRGGAWPIADYYANYAECQAICRFVRGVLMQIGCPGTAEVVVVYADENVGNGKTALEDSMVPEDTRADRYAGNQLSLGLNRDQGRTVADHKEFQALAADVVTVGEIIDPGQILNMFEACLKFTHGGVTRYYGGGMPGSALGSAQEVLKTAFSSLVRVSYLSGHERKIERIVTTQAEW